MLAVFLAVLFFALCLLVMASPSMSVHFYGADGGYGAGAGPSADASSPGPVQPVCIGSAFYFLVSNHN